MSTCGYSGFTHVLECTGDGVATLMWQRRATAEEVDLLHHTGDLPAHEQTADLAVFACDQDGVACGVWRWGDVPEGGIEPAPTGVTAADLHDATCRAPGANEPGNCGVCDA